MTHPSAHQLLEEVLNELADTPDPTSANGLGHVVRDWSPSGNSVLYVRCGSSAPSDVDNKLSRALPTMLEYCRTHGLEPHALVAATGSAYAAERRDLAAVTELIARERVRHLVCPDERSLLAGDSRMRALASLLGRDGVTLPTASPAPARTG